MLATDFTRDDCLVGKTRRAYDILGREWRCVCGGRLNMQWSDDTEAHPDHWYIRCIKCGGCDFIHEAQLARNQALVREMFANLPKEVVASYLERRTEQCQS